MKSNIPFDYDAIVIGGGPVGLLVANLLGAQGRRCLVAERRTRPLAESMAIGITPPSLETLSRIDLDAAFVSCGVCVEDAFVHGDRDLLGHVDLRGIPSAYPFILTLPQAETVRLLRERLASWRKVDYLPGTELTHLEQDHRSATATLQNLASQQALQLSAPYVIACDGYRGGTRRLLGLRERDKAYRPTFLMADFEDRTAFGREAHLFFTSRGSVESFPLPGGKRRWIVLTKRLTTNPAPDYLQSLVRKRAGVELSGCSKYYERAFETRRMMAERYGLGRVFLCGDAAHTMSPIGGQGMNTGFGDAAKLADLLCDDDGRAPDALLDEYERTRSKPFRTAAGRSATAMWIGTRSGKLPSVTRNSFVKRLLANETVRDKLLLHFAMLDARLPTGPGITIAREDERQFDSSSAAAHSNRSA